MILPARLGLSGIGWMLARAGNGGRAGGGPEKMLVIGVIALIVIGALIFYHDDIWAWIDDWWRSMQDEIDAHDLPQP